MNLKYKDYYNKFNISDVPKEDRAEVAMNEREGSFNRLAINEVGYANAYIPFQESLDMFPMENGFVNGTIFVDLNRPYKKGHNLNNFGGRY